MLRPTGIQSIGAKTLRRGDIAVVLAPVRRTGYTGQMKLKGHDNVYSNDNMEMVINECSYNKISYNSVRE